ncbi:tryptophan--tRNA ligase [Candidatus Symbiobacter mobilis]|uniref:Tryptophan--tRNA ligase n=1 Tax=Candidatus Symbiobacter mobilis CR TaxID=946483 RepID=U5NE88_9BURK|nr:tryptophan--tRNA ligase [Candidatus Symbiobacter mobilis]AGX88454.1 tryptophanyl-tRNA synthetase [Candidatus Symbiobacter mobilis CR]
MQRDRFLTGITTSGTPHLGNYVGSIRPAVAASRRDGAESFYFLADYHALIKTFDPERVARSTLDIAASWLACGLDPERVVFYRQSDIPEIPELAWLLGCVTGKGLLNRAHAYKAAMDRNTAAGDDADANVSVGLFLYPVLMGADILLFRATHIPVGRDQVQHIEMARDMAQSFNARYGNHFVAPAALVEEHVAVLPGLDGRKMSKSYDNIIPLFAPRETLRKLIYGIQTDSRTPGEPKDAESSALYPLFRAFATPQQSAAFCAALAEGMAWGDAKAALFDCIDADIAPLRTEYDALVRHPDRIETILRHGAERARAIAVPFLRELRSAVGLRPLGATVGHGNTKATVSPPATPTTKAAKTARPILKQYRERDGRFHCKLLNAEGATVLHSTGFDTPQLLRDALSALRQGADTLPDGLCLAGGASLDVVVQTLAAMETAGTSPQPVQPHS